jgi:hypothetical protein
VISKGAPSQEVELNVMWRKSNQSGGSRVNFTIHENCIDVRLILEQLFEFPDTFNKTKTSNQPKFEQFKGFSSIELIERTRISKGGHETS